MPTPYSVHVFDEVTSTQDVAKALFQERPVVVVAGQQTAGRGRGGSDWVTAPRALAVTVAFASDWSPHVSVASLVAGLAAASILGPEVDLKWPNDLLVGDRKVGGILVEVAGRVVAVGCGVNLWWPDPPSERGALWTTDPGVGAGIGLGVAFAEELFSRLAGADWGADQYRARCVTLARPIAWSGGKSGFARDIDSQDGSLIVEVEGGGIVRLHAGEIRHLRLSPSEGGSTAEGGEGGLPASRDPR
ncbi:MAG TPA: biotin--[acetyl-CoA-carboxylase] ligase [Acidimicrobiia bacterium]|nr:biotin--[acetyl-CoA-carboxylase] ligase [Acidimicrobiia bacterium]